MIHLGKALASAGVLSIRPLGCGMLFARSVAPRLNDEYNRTRKASSSIPMPSRVSAFYCALRSLASVRAWGYSAGKVQSR